MTAQRPATRQPPSRRRRGDGPALRAVVLDVATDLLARTGDVALLTMRDVATAAGVTAPSVYRHFPDKESLVRAVIDDRFTAFTAVLRDAVTAAGPDPWARLAAMAHAYVDHGLSHSGHYRVLFSATHAGPAGLGLDAEARHPGAASFGLLVDAVAACLPAGRTERAPLLAVELWASLHGVVDLRATKPDMPWPDPGDLTDTALAAVRAASEGDR